MKPTKYKGWEITQLPHGSYKATKDNHTINCSSVYLLYKLIDEDTSLTNERPKDDRL